MLVDADRARADVRAAAFQRHPRKPAGISAKVSTERLIGIEANGVVIRFKAPEPAPHCSSNVLIALDLCHKGVSSCHHTAAVKGAEVAVHIGDGPAVHRDAHLLGPLASTLLLAADPGYEPAPRELTVILAQAGQTEGAICHTERLAAQTTDSGLRSGLKSFIAVQGRGAARGAGLRFSLLPSTNLTRSLYGRKQEAARSSSNKRSDDFQGSSAVNLSGRDQSGYRLTSCRLSDGAGEADDAVLQVGKDSRTPWPVALKAFHEAAADVGPAVDQLPWATVTLDFRQRVVGLVGVALQEPATVSGEELQRMFLPPPGGAER